MSILVTQDYSRSLNNMATLLLDSSNTSLSVGVECNGKLLDYTSYEAWQAQSEHMIPEIDALLKKYSLSRKDITAVMTSIGPGSYTGVRIALTIAKVIALCLGVEVYPISSLRVLKNNDVPSICLINARSGRSYFGVYHKDKIIVEDTIKTNKEVLNYIKEHPTYSICGNVSYLGFENLDSNICLQMVSLLNVIKPCENALALKPVYLKD